MAVGRFYLEASGTPPATPTITADWEHTNTARSPMGMSKAGTALALTSYSPDAADHLVSGDAHFRQFISPLLPAQTFAAQTVKLQIQGSETHAGNNCSLTWKVYAVAADDLAVLGTLVAIRRDATEFTTSVVNRGDSVTSIQVVASEDCYLVLEVGLGGTPTGAGGVQGHNGALRFGSNGASGDLPENETETGTTFDPWIEFADISLPALEITGAGAIASGEAFGSDSVDHAVAASGIASGEVVGAQVLAVALAAAGIGSAEAVGSVLVALVAAPAGLASGEQFGGPTVELGGGEAFIDPAGIASGELVGAAALAGAVDVAGIPSGEALGAPSTQLVAAPAGIASQEGFGSSSLGMPVSPAGIGSSEALGAPALAAGLSVVGIVSGEQFGLGGLAVVLVASGIQTGEALGAVAVMPVTLVAATGIPSGEALSAGGSLHHHLAAFAIASGEAFGALAIDDGSEEGGEVWVRLRPRRRLDRPML